MAKKFLVFNKLKDTAGNPCYQVKNNSNNFLGDLYFEKITSRSKPILTFNSASISHIGNYMWWTAECLIELAEFMQEKMKEQK